MKNKKLKAKKILTNILCMALVTSNILPAMATYTEESFTYSEKTNDSQETEVFYNNGVGDYFVRMPKLITLGKEKTCAYSVEVNGDISSDKQVYVSPIDSLKDTENFDFYMIDQSTVNRKQNVVATVNQNKFYWNFEEARDGYIETENSVSALSLSAGTWKGTFDFEINMHSVTGSGEETKNEILENWDYTLDEENDIVTLNYYIGDETDVYVHSSYELNDKVYTTQLASNSYERGMGFRTPYIFNGYAQKNCSNIESITFDKDIDTSNVTDMSYMFYGCSSLTNLDISCFNTENVTNMSNMFSSCQQLKELNLINFDTSKVKDMSSMFLGCGFDSLDLSNFDTSKVTGMSFMFASCWNLVDLNVSSFDTSNVIDMMCMFAECSWLTSLNLSNFNTKNVVTMNEMFRDCHNLENLNVSNFNTENVYTMAQMFKNCTHLTSLDLSSFTTSSITYVEGMFNECPAEIYVGSNWYDDINMEYGTHNFIKK